MVHLKIQVGLAGATSDTIGILGEAINPLVEEAKNNKLLGPMFDSIKEGAISALDTIKDGFGMNDWIYNVKEICMYLLN